MKSFFSDVSEYILDTKLQWAEQTILDKTNEQKAIFMQLAENMTNLASAADPVHVATFHQLNNQLLAAGQALKNAEAELQALKDQKRPSAEVPLDAKPLTAP